MLTEQIKSKVFEYLKDLTKTDDWDVINSGIEARQSVVYRLVSQQYPSELALKVYKTKSSAPIKLQYDSLENFHLKNKNKKFRIPKPYGLFKEDGFYIMEWVYGEPLSKILWKNCFFKGPLQKNILRSYEWLNNYHSHANLNIKEIDFSKYSRSIELSLEKCGSQSFFNENPLFKHSFETLKAFESNFVGYETYHADLHGDLNLGNIIIDDNSVIGIDIGARLHLPVQNDIAQMLTHICTNYFLMLPRSAMREDISTWDIFNVVLDAYKYSDDKKARDFFLFVFLHQLIQRWITTHYYNKENKNSAFTYHVPLGKWRMYNCSVIIEGITKVINERYLK